jgi:hypothetical protein
MFIPRRTRADWQGIMRAYLQKFADGGFPDFFSHILARYNILIFNLRWYEVKYQICQISTEMIKLKIIALSFKWNCLFMLYYKDCLRSIVSMLRP